MNPAWPTTITLGGVGQSNATTLPRTLAPLQKLLVSGANSTYFAAHGSASSSFDP